jgi:hypothetical protein
MLIITPKESLAISLGQAHSTTAMKVFVSVIDKISLDGRIPSIQKSFKADTNGTTNVTICPAPLEVPGRAIDFLSVHNIDTVTHNTKIKIISNGDEFILASMAINAGHSLHYTPETGFVEIVQ